MRFFWKLYRRNAPAFFRKPEEVGVVYKKIEMIYFTKYYIFEFENGKISNVKNVD